MEQNYETYELILKDEEDGTFALSLVSEPAIMQDFVWLNKDGKVEIKFASVDEDKHLIVGPILIPNLKILRLKEDGTPYYVQFSPEMVKKIAQKYIKDNNANNITLEHANSVSDISLVESWVADSVQFDKARAYGLPVKVGTWFGVFKVDNQNIWDNFVKTGKVKGISLEGLFTHELLKASKIEIPLETILDKQITELSETEADVLLSHLKALIKKDKRYGKGQRVEMESYSDYGSGIRGNAKRGIELNEKNNNKCATQTGKVRAQQLANGEPISVETIKRMYSYLSRAETYYDENDMNACGTISYLLWGGKAGLSWSRNKLKELGLFEGEGQPSIPASSYPGEGPGKKKKNYIHPALIGTKK
jgi:hypothetical protein